PTSVRTIRTHGARRRCMPSCRAILVRGSALRPSAAHAGAHYRIARQLYDSATPRAGVTIGAVRGILFLTAVGLLALTMGTRSTVSGQIIRSDKVLRSGIDAVTVTATVLDADG